MNQQEWNRFQKWLVNRKSKEPQHREISYEKILFNSESFEVAEEIIERQPNMREGIPLVKDFYRLIKIFESDATPKQTGLTIHYHISQIKNTTTFNGKLVIIEWGRHKFVSVSNAQVTINISNDAQITVTTDSQGNYTLTINGINWGHATAQFNGDNDITSPLLKCTCVIRNEC